MLDKKPKDFIFFLWIKPTSTTRLKWMVIHNNKKYIVDKIIACVKTTTQKRLQKPSCVMKGKGILRFEVRKAYNYKNVIAIIE